MIRPFSRLEISGTRWQSHQISDAAIPYPATMQDKTINNALLTLRKQTSREGGDGPEHVEAL